MRSGQSGRSICCIRRYIEAYNAAVLAAWGPLQYKPFSENCCILNLHAGAADLAARTKQLADMEAERARARSEAGAAGRAADKLAAQLAAVPKVGRSSLSHCVCTGGRVLSI